MQDNWLLSENKKQQKYKTHTKPHDILLNEPIKNVSLCTGELKYVINCHDTGNVILEKLLSRTFIKYKFNTTICTVLIIGMVV